MRTINAAYDCVSGGNSKGITDDAVVYMLCPILLLLFLISLGCPELGPKYWDIAFIYEDWI
jgi:hypothetical protein